MKLKSHSASRRSSLDRKYPRCRVYAVELSPDACQHPGFLDGNPSYQIGQPCVYIGMTSLTPEKRLAVHRSGIGSEIVLLHGLRLRPDLIPAFAAKPRYQAMRLEREITRKLRSRGMGTWQH